MKYSKKMRDDFIFETKDWKVYLNPDQYYLGRCRVVVKRGVDRLSDLTNNEWLDFARLVKKFETGLKKAFMATMFNWTCLMNNAYQNNPPNPHVHWHVRPRYKKAVNFEGLKFEDKEFGNHYASGIDRKIPEKVFTEIIKKIRRAMSIANKSS